MAYERLLVTALEKALSRQLPVFQVITGPRQVGKTTIARQLMERLPYPSVYAAADSPLPHGPEWIETQWRLAEVEASKTQKPVFLVLDELQKVKGWSETLKLHWDRAVVEGRDVRLLVLGSSALLLQEGLTESLAGRFFLNRCMHWGLSEVSEAFGWDLKKWIYFGGFSEEESAWKRYVADSLIETVLARDVLQMQRVAKPALLRHLFALSAAFPAQIFSYNKMLGQLQDAGNATTLAGYLRLLQAAFLVSGLELYSKGTARKRGSSPKLILWNNALISALSTRTFQETVSDERLWGRLVENAVGAHLCNSLPRTDYDIAYWRDGNHEVDFVVSAGTDAWAVEVKSGRSGWSSGLERFRAKYPKAETMIVGEGGIPLERFFHEPAQVWFRK
jgi:hypothetical protein